MDIAILDHPLWRIAQNLACYLAGISTLRQARAATGAMNLKTAVGRSDVLAVCDVSRFGCVNWARGGAARGACGR